MATLSTLPTFTTGLTSKNHSLDWTSPQLREQIISTFSEDEIKQLSLPPKSTEVKADEYSALEKVALSNVVAKEKARGPEHIDTLTAMHTLGMLHSELGEHARAESTWRKMLTTQEKDRPNSSLATRSNLGFTMVRQGKYAEAEEIARQLLPVLQAQLGRDSPQALRTLRQLMKALSIMVYSNVRTLNLIVSDTI